MWNIMSLQNTGSESYNKILFSVPKIYFGKGQCQNKGLDLGFVVSMSKCDANANT